MTGYSAEHAALRLRRLRQCSRRRARRGKTDNSQDNCSRITEQTHGSPPGYSASAATCMRTMRSGSRGGSPRLSLSTTSMPSTTSPITVYWRLRKWPSSNMMKNWLLAESLLWPLRAMPTMVPGVVLRMSVFSGSASAMSLDSFAMFVRGANGPQLFRDGRFLDVVEIGELASEIGVALALDAVLGRAVAARRSFAVAVVELVDHRHAGAGD